MNTYGENLQGVATKVLSNGEMEAQKRESDLSIARSNLYYTVGEQLLAKEKREKVNHLYDQTDSINHQGVLCSSRADNMLDSAVMADDRVTALVTNTATAAQNVQAAADAVVKLAADIGSANNIVSASEYDTDIQRMTSEVNKAINEVAYNAKDASESTMLSSAESSQIIAKQVLAEATRTKSLFTDMLTRTNAELDKLTQTRITDTTTLIAATTKRRKMRGRLKVAQKESAAIERSCFLSNQTLNLGLTVTPTSMNSVTIEFAEMNAPFPFEKGSGTAPFPFEKGSGTDNKQFHEFPMKSNKYYIGVCKSDTKEMVTLDFAQSAFGNYYDEKDITENRFFNVTPNIPNDITLGMPAPTQADDGEQANNALAWDLDGDEIEAGKSYVVFLYIVVDSNYKRKLNNFSDALSSPSRPFTMTAKLKAPMKDTIRITPNGSSVKITFKVDDYGHVLELAEYRIILVSENALTRTSNRASLNENQAKMNKIAIWFDEKIASQVARVNYGIAQLENGQFEATVSMSGDEAGVNFRQLPNTLYTDNFGQLLIKGTKYLYWVFAVVPEINPDAAKYTPNLYMVPHSIGGRSNDSQPDEAPIDTKSFENEIRSLKDKHEELASAKAYLESELEKQSSQNAELSSHKQRLEDEIQSLRNEQASSGKQSKKKK